jgi:hypothetical protein
MRDPVEFVESEDATEAVDLAIKAGFVYKDIRSMVIEQCEVVKLLTIKDYGEIPGRVFIIGREPGRPFLRTLYAPPFSTDTMGCPEFFGMDS